MRSLWDQFTAETSYAPYPAPAFSPSLLTDLLAFIAEEDGTAVGSVYAATPSAHHGFVFGLYVVPAARRRGLAHELMRAVVEALRDEGRSYVELNVDTPNTAAHALYEELGFRDAARILRADVSDLLR